MRSGITIANDTIVKEEKQGTLEMAPIQTTPQHKTPNPPTREQVTKQESTLIKEIIKIEDESDSTEGKYTNRIIETKEIKEEKGGMFSGLKNRV